jgi:hypothetical protein
MENNEPTNDAAVYQRSGIRLIPGDCFAYDCLEPDGDILYVEVLDSIPRFPEKVDRVGKAAGGYRVGVHSFDGPSRVEDFYAWDWVDERCVRLNAEQMRRARDAGWPDTHAHFREVFGNEIVIPTGEFDECSPRAEPSSLGSTTCIP